MGNTRTSTLPLGRVGFSVASEVSIEFNIEKVIRMLPYVQEALASGIITNEEAVQTLYDLTEISPKHAKQTR